MNTYVGAWTDPRALRSFAFAICTLHSSLEVGLFIQQLRLVETRAKLSVVQFGAVQ